MYSFTKTTCLNNSFIWGKTKLLMKGTISTWDNTRASISTISVRKRIKWKLLPARVIKVWSLSSLYLLTTTNYSIKGWYTTSLIFSVTLGASLKWHSWSSDSFWCQFRNTALSTMQREICIRQRPKTKKSSKLATEIQNCNLKIVINIWRRYRTLSKIKFRKIG